MLYFIVSPVSVLKAGFKHSRSSENNYNLGSFSEVPLDWNTKALVSKKNPQNLKIVSNDFPK